MSQPLRISRIIRPYYMYMSFINVLFILTTEDIYIFILKKLCYGLIQYSMYTELSLLQRQQNTQLLLQYVCYVMIVLYRLKRR